MDYVTALKTCSEEVQVAITWLEEKIRFGRRELENSLKEEKDRDRIKDISRRLKVKYLCDDAIELYVLSKVNSPLLKEFLDAAKREEFWLDKEGPEGFDEQFFYVPYLLWYLSKLGLKSNEYFKEALQAFIKKPQTREGKIPTGDYPPHTWNLRVLTSVEPDSEATDLAVRYFLDNLIDDLGEFLKSEQKREGYWGENHQWNDGTSLLIEALSRIFGQNDECVIKAVEWIKRIQKEHGYWSADACLALISAGEGPKASLEEFEWNEMLTRQKLERIKPKFVQTSPNLGVREIKEKLHKMLNNANERIWVCSRFITEFWNASNDKIQLTEEKVNNHGQNRTASR